MKKCSSCGQEKPFECFALNKTKPDGRHNKCKDCKKIYNKEYYQRTKHIHNPSRQTLKEKNRALARTFVRKLKMETPCSDCGKCYPYFVMDFDHLSDKSFNISEMVGSGYSLDQIRSEISKCEIVCANCHRIRTFHRLGHFDVFIVDDDHLLLDFKRA